MIKAIKEAANNGDWMILRINAVIQIMLQIYLWKIAESKRKIMSSFLDEILTKKIF